MLEAIAQWQQKLAQTVIVDQATLEKFRYDFVGKKGGVGMLLAAFKALPPSEKKVVGSALHSLKQMAMQRFKEAVQQLETQATASIPFATDVTLPAMGPPLGSLHPLRIIQDKIVAIFTQMGFNLVTGNEIVADWENFTALNFPENHPAREMQDSFFLQRNPDYLLRTHTTSVQVTTCSSLPSPPIRAIAVGRVFRNEAISARSHCFFHQVDGMYIHTDVSFSDLKKTIAYFVQALFGPSTQLRFRASFFPFTEPSTEVDISCSLCQGKGCSLCKDTGWVEILGAGMVDPHVLEHCHIDPSQYRGFAFGMGVERITMLCYKIDDVRLFFENHLAFLRQFTAC